MPLHRLFEQRKKNRLLEFVESWHMRMRNLWAHTSVTDPVGPVVSLTTFGVRIQLVYLTLESIARGTVRPSRLILWISEDERDKVDIASLRRLVNRGLEIRFCEDWGPHKKYYPYVESTERFDRPLVTADDDVLYPDYWLQRLVSAHGAEPNVIHCYRAHHVSVMNGQIQPYNTWPACHSDRPSFLTFATGVSGVIYPESFLEVARQAGRGFTDKCPRADDVWLHHLAVTSGHRVRQIQATPVHFVEVRGARASALHRFNVKQGGNDAQVASTYSLEAIERLHQQTDT